MARPANIRIRGARPPVPQNTLLGRSSRGTGDLQPLTLAQLRAMGLSSHGDVAVAVSGAVPAIAAGDLLANITGSTAQAIGVTASAYLDSVFSSSKGAILYRDASAWMALAPGSNGNVLELSGGIPSWAAPAATGVTQINAGTGITLSPSPITSTGSVSLATGAAAANLGYTPAHSGNNSDITQLLGLTTPLTVAQGGTGANNVAAAGLGLKPLNQFQLTTSTTLTSGSIGCVIQLSASSTQTLTFPFATEGAYAVINTGTAAWNLSFFSGSTLPSNTIQPGEAMILYCDPNLGGTYYCLAYSTMNALAVNRGGTGAATFTADGVLYGNGTGAIQATSVGSSGQVLTSNGAGNAPTFQAASGGSGTVTSITAGTGLSGGTITTTGTVPLPSGAAAANLGYTPAHSGANSDITSLSGLTTPLSIAQGGTNGATANAARTQLAVPGLTTTNTFTGANTFSGHDLSVNGITVGLGASAVASNTAVGTAALQANTTGTGNTGVSSGALFTNTTGFNNVAVGQNALFSNLGGNSNIAVGNTALFGVTSGSNNFGMGTQSGRLITSGSGNIAIGGNTLGHVTTTNNNVAIGANALSAATGAQNTAIGFNAGTSLGAFSDCVLIGSNTGSSISSSFTVMLSDGAANPVYTANATLKQAIIPLALSLQVYTVGTLPSGMPAGTKSFVSDATTTTFASIVAGSGSNTVPVYYDGTNWRIG